MRAPLKEPAGRSRRLSPFFIRSLCSNMARQLESRTQNHASKITLEIGQLTQTVEVTATASVLQTESEAVQAQVTGQQIRDQQLNGRNPLYMGQMLPGVRSGSTLGDFNFA